jgi:RNA polymerase sigma-70 factor (ECF subfamily)
MTMTTGDQDRDLVEVLRLRDPAAAEHLVARYSERAHRLASRILRNAQDAEEVVQDAFWAVLRRIDTFRGDSAFGTWLHRIIANAAYEKLRATRRRRTELSLDDLLPSIDEHRHRVEPLVDWSLTLNDPSMQAELRAVLSAAIDDLRASYRSVIVLRDIEGLSSPEISTTLNLSVPNVKSRTHRARLLLRKRLDEYITYAPRRDVTRVTAKAAVAVA